MVLREKLRVHMHKEWEKNLLGLEINPKEIKDEDEDPLSDVLGVQLDDDTYFKDLVESIKAYLIEYPKKKNFPVGIGCSESSIGTLKRLVFVAF